MLAFFLCLTMAGSIIAEVFPEQTKAAPQSVNVGQTMELSTQIQVGGKTTEIKAQIGYTYVKQDTPADDAQGYTRGEWIQMLAGKVEMNLDTDPAAINHYFADTEGNEHEVAIETAQAYGILPPADVEDLEQDIPFSSRKNRRHANLQLTQQYTQWDTMAATNTIRAAGRTGRVSGIRMRRRLRLERDS